MKALLRVVAVLAAVATAAGPAEAQPTLYAAASPSFDLVSPLEGVSSPSTLYRIDPSTGAATRVGDIGFNDVGGMDFDASGNLWAVGRAPATGQPFLLSINLTTGAGTPVAPLALPSQPVQIADPTVRCAGCAVEDLAFRAADGMLYAVDRVHIAGRSVAFLSKINPATGAVTNIGPFPFIGFLGTQDMSALAFFPDDTTLFALGGEAFWIKVDPATALVVPFVTESPDLPVRPGLLAEFFDSSGTLVGQLFGDAGQALAIRPDTHTIYGVTQKSGVSNCGGLSCLFTVDPTIVDGQALIATQGASIRDAATGVGIGGVAALAWSPLSVETATGAGPAIFSTNAGSFSSLAAVPEASLPAAGKPAGVAFPFGFFAWTVSNLTPGQTVIVTIAHPAPVPAGAQYWKVIGGIWTDVTSALGDNDGDKVLTLTITDGGLGDADGIANGQIADPGGVGIVAANQPPVADAGPDQTVECNNPTGTPVTLNGSASSDPDGDSLMFTWTGPFGTVSGSTPTVSLPVGINVITLTVADPGGLSDTDVVIITVQDTGAPQVTAALVPVGERDDDEGRFRVAFTCSDTCDAVTATATLNGIPVVNGQVVELEADDETEARFGGGILALEAPAFRLVVTCTDASGNVGTATATPPFAPDDDEDEDDDEEGD